MAKRDARKYKWYKYGGKKITIETKDFSIDLAKGELFGLNKVGTRFYLVDQDRDVQVPLTEFDANRLANNSKGYGGKIGQYTVVPGVGGAEKERGEGEVHINSSLFARGHYNKDTKKLTLEFKSGAVWEYADVKPKEVLLFETSNSQGRFYNDNIKMVKIGQRLHSFSSESSNHPMYYTTDQIPSEPEILDALPARFGIGSRVTLFFGTSEDEPSPNDQRVYGCVVCAVHFYSGKVAYDVYVPAGEERVDVNDATSAETIYTLLVNIDSVCVVPS